MIFSFFGWMLSGLIRLFGRTIYRLKIRGYQNVPSTGGALLVANHASYMDFVLVVCSIPRQVRFVMNADIFRKPGLKWILQGLQCIPISPRGGKNNFVEFNLLVSEQVNAGNVVVIFAEGTVTRTGQLLEFKKGVEHLSGMITSPIIPIHFHNVQGTPFSYRAGKNRQEKFALRNLRREIQVNIGTPLHGKIQAFALRQRMKEMEVENFNHQLSNHKPIHEILREKLDEQTIGSWNTGESSIQFAGLRRKLLVLDRVLEPLLCDDEKIGLLLPKDADSYVLQLWLIMNRKVVVIVNPEFSNEERFFVINKSGVSTLITTMDLAFSRFSPNAERVIYREHINEAMADGKSANIFYKKMRDARHSVHSMFVTNSKLDDVVTVVFEKKKGSDELTCVALSHRNILSTILGLRQVYFFEKDSRMMSNLPTHHAYGFIIEFLLPLIYELHLEIVQEDITSVQFTQKLMATRPSIVIATPTQLHSIAELSQIKNIPFLTHIFTADLHPDHHNIQLLGNRGIDVFVCAGMNETSSVFAVNLHNYKGKDISGKIFEQENMEDNTIGKPLPGVALKVCDDRFKELTNDEVGSLWIKGACISPPASTDNECHNDLVEGWFNTGLQGSVNHKGFIKLQPNQKAIA